MIDGLEPGDPGQPTLQRALLSVESIAAAPGREEHLLGEIFGIAADDTSAQTHDEAAMQVECFSECSLVSGDESLFEAQRRHRANIAIHPATHRDRPRVTLRKHQRPGTEFEQANGVHTLCFGSIGRSDAAERKWAG